MTGWKDSQNFTMNEDLVDLLREAFEAGTAAAAAYELGTFVVDFRKWKEDNRGEIEALSCRVIPPDGHTKHTSSNKNEKQEH